MVQLLGRADAAARTCPDQCQRDGRGAGPGEMLFEFHGVNAADPPVYANEDVAQAEARLTAFTRAIVPVLDAFLPK